MQKMAATNRLIVLMEASQRVPFASLRHHSSSARVTPSWPSQSGAPILSRILDAQALAPHLMRRAQLPLHREGGPRGAPRVDGDEDLVQLQALAPA